MATKKRREKSNKAKLGDLRRLLTPLIANSGELGHLEATRTRFAEILAQAEDAADRQRVHAAAKQEASLQFRNALTESERLANILRLAVKQHYGIGSEKLAEFGLQPFRGRKAKDAEATEPSAPSPSEPQPSAPVDPTRL